MTNSLIKHYLEITELTEHILSDFQESEANTTSLLPLHRPLFSPKHLFPPDTILRPGILQVERWKGNVDHC